MSEPYYDGDPVTLWHGDALDVLRRLPDVSVDALRFDGNGGHEHERTVPMAEISLEAMARFLLANLEWLRHHRAGHEAVEELTAAVWEVARVIDRPPEREYVGPCRDCGADIYGKPGAAVAECRPCGVGYDVAEMREWMKAQIYGRLVTAREGSALLCRFGLETKQATIDTWVQRGRLTPRQHSPEGRRMYLFDDLVSLAARSQSPDTPITVRVVG